MTIRRGLRSIGVFAFAMLVLGASIVGPTLSPKVADALYHRGTYYFSGTAGYLPASACNVKSDGYYGGASHDNFINAVKAAEARPADSSYWDRTCGGQDYDAIGARYVVYSMLGRGVQYNDAVKWNRISSADWAEFDRRVRTTTMSQEWRKYNQDGCLSSAVSDTVEDANQFNEPSWVCGNDYLSVVFRVGTSTVFIIDTNCMNPIGNYAGPPGLDYNLTPTVTSVSPAAQEAGGSAQITASVKNVGTTASDSVGWRVTMFVLGASGTYPVPGDSATLPETYYGNGATFGASGAGTFGVGDTSVTIPLQTVPDDDVGKRVCYTLSVARITQSNGNWRNSGTSATTCLIIAKKPKVQVTGSDLIVGKGATSNIVTSSSTKSGHKFGSWSEYAIIASGTVTGMGSGSAYAGLGLTSTSNCSYTFLTFSNAATTNCSQRGGYSTGRTVPDIASSYPASATTSPPLSGDVDVSGLSGIYTGTGTLKITGGVVGVGKTVVINTPGDVIISANTTYTTARLYSTGDIPQLIIIASNIYINEAVTQVDAWLVTNGTLNTCHDVATNLITDTRCKDKLTINGPVVAGEAQLWRTAGSTTGATSGEPAEVFNLRPDAYLWGLSQNTKSGRLETVYQQELPPRF